MVKELIYVFNDFKSPDFILYCEIGCTILLQFHVDQSCWLGGITGWEIKLVSGLPSPLC